MAIVNVRNPLVPNEIYHGDARQLLRRIARESIALSMWSPPYAVGGDRQKAVRSFEIRKKEPEKMDLTDQRIGSSVPKQ